jgi:hypothetical protein
MSAEGMGRLRNEPGASSVNLHLTKGLRNRRQS